MKIILDCIYLCIFFLDTWKFSCYKMRYLYFEYIHLPSRSERPKATYKYIKYILTNYRFNYNILTNSMKHLYWFVLLLISRIATYALATELPKPTYKPKNNNKTNYLLIYSILTIFEIYLYRYVTLTSKYNHVSNSDQVTKAYITKNWLLIEIPL